VDGGETDGKKCPTEKDGEPSSQYQGRGKRALSKEQRERKMCREGGGAGEERGRGHATEEGGDAKKLWNPT